MHESRGDVTCRLDFQLSFNRLTLTDTQLKVCNAGMLLNVSPQKYCLTKPIFYSLPGLAILLAAVTKNHDAGSKLWEEAESNDRH